jgi:hypothetical protein
MGDNERRTEERETSKKHEYQKIRFIHFACPVSLFAVIWRAGEGKDEREGSAVTLSHINLYRVAEYLLS